MPKTAEHCLISLNPANGEALGFVEITPSGDVATLVEQSRAAIPAWGGLSGRERRKILNQVADALLANATALGEMLSEEIGKTRRLGLREIQGGARDAKLRTAHTLAAIEPWQQRSELVESTVHYDPLGVCAVIAPCSHPVSMALWMMIPALAAGNTVLLKPSEEAPLISQHMVETFQRFLPEGVLQVLHGDAEQGKALVAANVNLIAFTGSRAAGKHVMAGAAYGVKRLVLELGGKDSLIVLADADIEAAARFAVDNSFENAGQSCIATESILVDSSIAQVFLEQVRALSEEIRIGSWNDPNADIGPIISASRRQRVIKLIDDAISKGGVALVGGDNHPEHFVRPTVLLNVNDDMDIAHEEVFGPVACVRQFSDAKAAVEMANQSSFALGCVVFGSDEAAAAIARQLDAGMVGINKSIHGTGDTPWVGAKQSGFGYHGSADGYRQFTQARVVSRHL